MKLIFCPDCCDVRALRMRQERVTCACGASTGVINGLHATISGKAIPLGIHNAEFIQAVNSQPYDGQGREFLAFVIPKVCHTVKST